MFDLSSDGKFIFSLLNSPLDTLNLYPLSIISWSSTLRDIPLSCWDGLTYLGIVNGFPL